MRSAAIFILCAGLLAACGGGGAGDPAPVDPPAGLTTPTPTPTPSASPSPSPTPTPTPTPSPPPSGADLVWGVNGHPFTAYPGITYEQQLDLLVQLGVKDYRVNLRASTAFDDLERILPVAAARGITILPIVTPDFSLQNDSAEIIYARSRTFSEQIARRFAGRIKVWELGNELENYAIIQPCEMRDDGTQYPCAWGPAGGVGPLEYYGPRWAKVSAALKGMTEGVKAADPSALRAIGTAGWGHSGAFDRMKADGIQWDISIWHQYQLNQDAVIERVAAHGKPIWITEFNFGDPISSDENVQAQKVREMMERFRTVRVRFNIQRAYFYELLDEPYWTDFEGKQGMVHLDRTASGGWQIGTKKPVFNVIRGLISPGS
jgi:hypothetical protein